jgi:outer membrane protein OmpA-like peptidoglycan-associated protein
MLPVLKAISTFVFAACWWTIPSSTLAQGNTRLKIKKLPATINTGFEESKPITTQNGDSLYFVRSNYPGNKGGEYAGQDVWISERADSVEWTMADNRIPGLNDLMPNIVIGIAGDGSGIYHLGYLFAGDQRSVTLHFSQKRQGQYSNSELIDIKPIKVGMEYHDLYMHPDGDVLIISMSALNSIGREDLYVCSLGVDGSWTGPVHMGSVVNTRGFEIAPFLSNDKQTLYFSSDGFNGYGDADIYRSSRLGQGWVDWTSPENLGPPFNSKKFDAYYFENDIGEMYLASNRASAYSDLYLVLEVGSDTSPVADGVMGDDKAAEADLAMQAGLNGLPEDSVGLLLTFDLDQYSLKEQHLKNLETFLTALKEPGDFTLIVTGFTDDTGSESYNQKLSFRRATSVARQLRKYGLRREQLQMRGMGIYRKKDADQLQPEDKRRVELSAVRMRIQPEANPDDQ